MSKILIGGTVAIDNVKTPTADETNLLGGSASFVALAATKTAGDSATTHLIGTVGNDFPQEHLDMLTSHGIDLSPLETSEHPSFTWTGEYHENMNDRTTHDVALTILDNWEVKVPADVQDASYIVLANMAPASQLQLLNQITATETFVVADTMDLWIQIAKDDLHEVLQKIDLLVLNESEAREFTGTNNLVAAGPLLQEKGPKYVIIKLGEFGAMLFGPGAAEKLTADTFFRLPAYPIDTLADPTGAGDSFLGALIGSLAAVGTTTPTFGQLKSAIVDGTVTASYTCEDFSTRALQAATPANLQERKDILQAITTW